MLQLIIVQQSGRLDRLYDYNLNSKENISNLQSVKVQLKIPKHKQSTYYIFHKKNQSKNIQLQIQHSKNLQSNTQGAIKDPQNYTILCAVEFIYQQLGKVSAKLIEASKIKLINAQSKEKKSTQLPYWIVRTMNKMNQSKGIQLKQKHLLKLGNRQLIINKLQPNSRAIQPISKSKVLNLDYKIQQAGISNTILQETIRCRFCALGLEDMQNLLVSICNCNVYKKSIHINCIQKWLTTKIKKDQKQSLINVKVLGKYCQQCQANFPIQIVKDHVTYNLMNFIGKKEFPFICLKNNLKIQNTCYITFDQKDQTKSKTRIIGRSQDAQPQQTDVTIQRKHCEIELSQDKFYIKDLQSKYGTLLYDPERYSQIEKKSILGFQIQSTVFLIREQ